MSQGQGSLTGDENSGSITASVATSFSEQFFTLGSTSDVPLPVELIDFEAKQDDAGVKLNWSTASETNNDYFIIERSYDASNFKKIGKIDGNGNSLFTNHYSFFDDQPFDGVNYYRLKQVDYDNNFEYSKIIPVLFNSSISKYGENDFTVYPNPYVSGQLYLNLQNFYSDEKIFVSLTNMYGEKVLQLTIDEFVNNIIQLNDYFYDRLNAGIYICTVETNNIKISKRLIIL